MTEETHNPAPRKQRLGVANGPGAAPESPPTTSPTASVVSNSAGAAPGKKVRMGSAPAAPATGEPAATQRTRIHSSEVLSAPQRTRMGVAAVPTEAVVPSNRMNQTARQSPPEANPVKASTAGQQSAAPRNSRLPANWKTLALRVATLLIAATVIVVGARWLRTFPDVQSFLTTYPGHPTLPTDSPSGMPGWMGWQHFLNIFFMVLIVRTGLLVRHEKKSPGSFTPKPKSFFAPKGSTPKKVSLSQWVHQSLDVLWLVNGIAFVVLLIVSSQWMKIIPTNLDVVPNAASAALQYASLDWPDENGWLYYNALQMLAYFATVFIAAPLAVLSGIRISTWWPDQNTRLTKIYPVEVARAIHFPVMLYFVAFTAVHVFLVFFTGALRNLNHMYTSRDVADWLGLVVFLLSLLSIAAAWFLIKPLFMRPIASKFGTLSK